jgi:hypothetical protein
MKLPKPTGNYCYLCNKPLSEYDSNLKPQPDDKETKDHIPPDCLFPKPKPSNLISVKCCYRCNQDHSEFDTQLQVMASLPFDRNPAGQRTLDEKVFQGIFGTGRQLDLQLQVLSTIRNVPNSNLARFNIHGKPFTDGMIQITKGLLRFFYPNFDYSKNHFIVIPLSPIPSEAQTRLIQMLGQRQYDVRGDRVFEFWRYVDETKNSGGWMITFYQCSAFVVLHKPPETFNLLTKLRMLWNKIRAKFLSDRFQIVSSRHWINYAKQFISLPGFAKAL